MLNETSDANGKSEPKSDLANTQSKPALQLDAPGVATKIAKRVKDEIDAYCVKAYDDGHRTHLGASLIGRDCKRYLWYVFRWCKHVKHDGRKQRLFNRGHREEARFIEWLEGIGFKIWFEDYDSDPLYYCAESDSYHLHSEVFNGKNSMLASLAGEVPRDGCNGLTFKQHVARAKLQGIEFKQYRISDCNGHFGGSLDGIAEFPPEWGINEPVLLEFKTSGTGAKFNNLVANQMPVEKKDHYAQTSTYGYKYKFRFVLYLCINKNDDDLHVEVAALNLDLGRQMIAKADSIISSQTPPSRLSDNSTFRDCRVCDMHDICHNGAAIEKNCRSCIHAIPIENAQWHCQLHSSTNGPIPKDIIPQGCGDYRPIE